MGKFHQTQTFTPDPVLDAKREPERNPEPEPEPEPAPEPAPDLACDDVTLDTPLTTPQDMHIGTVKDDNTIKALTNIDLGNSLGAWARGFVDGSDHSALALLSVSSGAELRVGNTLCAAPTAACSPSFRWSPPPLLSHVPFLPLFLLLACSSFLPQPALPLTLPFIASTRRPSESVPCSPHDQVGQVESSQSRGQRSVESQTQDSV
jgi:hypothetical protein